MRIMQRPDAAALLLLLPLLLGCPARDAARSACSSDPDCPSGHGCAQGECVACPPCGEGEACVAGACLPQLCGDVACPSGSGCVNGRCIDSRCLGITCPTNQACARGTCYPADCTTADCTEAEVCLQDRCVSAACAGVACDAGQTCAQGRCVDRSCEGVRCSAGAACLAGRCVPVACIGVSCPEGTLCAAGRCLSTTCGPRTCRPGDVCRDDRCTQASCVGLACEPGQRCADAVCVACDSAPEAACDDGEDNDCDGQRDCADGDCAGATGCSCAAGECGPGATCVGDLCLPSSCGDHPCRAGEGCQHGLCVAADCVGVPCPAGQACAAGRCWPQSCSARTCAPGEVCVGDTACVGTDCVSKRCGDGEVCAAGGCLPDSCGDTRCATGAACADGACLATSCIGIDCPAGTVCAQGRCLPATGPGCPAEGCPTGQACVYGACGWHDCDGLRCPGGEVCVAGACQPAALFEASCGDGRDEDGDGRTDCADSDCAGSPGCPCPTYACAAGDTCVGSTCLPSRCGDHPCRAGEGCLDGVCVGAGCVGVPCPAGQACAAGTCLPRSCSALACTPGEVCVGDTSCVATSCVSKTCGDGTVCAAGACLPDSCGATRCATGAACLDGECVATRCIGLACPGGTVCAQGRCLPTTGLGCPSEGCPAGQACVDGACGWHDCDGLSCPTGEACVAGACRATAKLVFAEGPAYDFGTRPVDASVTRTFTVTNSGGAPAALGTVTSAGLGLAPPYALAGGSCASGASLAPAGSCTLLVAFAPSSAGLAVDSIDLSYDDGAARQVARLALQGAGAAPGELSISDGPTYDFGSRPVGSVATQTFAVTNSGGIPARLGTVSGADVGLEGAYALGGGSSCSSGATLAPGETCTLVVLYAPTSAGMLGDSLDLAYDDGVASQVASRAVIGTGVSPAALTVSDGPTYGYGTHLAGSSTAKSFTVTNTGGWPATLGTVTEAGLGLQTPYALGAGSTCTTGLSLAPSHGCVLVVAFTPEGAGLAEDSLDLSYDDGTGPRTASRPLTGAGASAARLLLSGGPVYDFGVQVVGSSAAQTFTVDNSGGFAASLGTVSSAALGLAPPFALAGGSCTSGAQLAPGGSCTLVVSHAPEAAGEASIELALGYDDGAGARTASLALTGRGADAALLGLSEGPGFDFGIHVVGSTASQTFTVTNLGGVAATLGAITSDDLGLAAPYSLTGGTCAGGATLAPSAACTLVVAFAPSSLGIRSDWLTLGYDDGATHRTVSRAVTGTGATAALLTLSAGPYDFGTRPAGSSASHTFTVTNSGGSTATLGAVSTAGLGLSAPYSLAPGGSCLTGATIPASGSCTLVVLFAPTSTGPVTDAIELAYDDGATTQVVACTVTGAGTAAAALTLSDGPLYDFGTRPAGSSTSHTFTVTNSGAFAATLGPVSTAGLGLGGPYTLAGGTCSTDASLAPAAACTLVVRFEPTIAGTTSGTLALDYHDGAGSQTISRALSGTAANPALLTLSDGPSYDFGTRAVGSTATHAFTVTNSGGLPATLGPVTSAGLGLAAPFALAGGTCSTGAALPASGTCTLVVSYAPLGAALAGDSLELAYSDGAAARTVSGAITGTAATPALLSLSPEAGHDFGTRAVGSTASTLFTVTNSGQLPATLGAVTSAGLGLAAPYSLSGGTCSTGASLAASASCTLLVSYAPEVPGASGDLLALGYHDGTADQLAARTVTGVGASPGLLLISDGTTYDFGSHVTGSSAFRTFTVTNLGDFPASLGAVTSAGLGLTAPYSLSGGTCSSGLSLTAADTCTLLVVFAPTAAGAANDSIDLSYDDGATTRVTSRAVSGTGDAPALLTLSDGPSYPFATRAVGSTTAKTFTVTNSGSFAATLGTVTTAGLGLAVPFALTGGTCATGASVAAGSSCTLTVTYAPTAAGASSDSIDLAYHDGAASQQATRALSGSAASAALLTVSDGPVFDFGLQAVGSTASKTFTVTNSGSFAATLSTVTTAGLGLAAPYALSGGTCATGGTLAPAGSCTLVVTHAPGTAGSTSAAIALGYQDGATGQTASRAITGSAAGPAVLTLSESPSYDFGPRALGSTTTKTFTVTNSGSFAATLGTVTTAGLGLAAPFALTGGTCASGALLAAAATCTLTVSNAPTAAGASSDSLDLGYHDGAASRVATCAVLTTGVAPALLTLSEGPSYAFGSHPVGSTASRTFTVTNSGGFPATLATVSGAGLGLSLPYALAAGGTCTTGTSVSAGSSCSLVITFAPTVAGASSGSVVLGYHDGTADQTTTSALTGTGVGLAVLTISDGPLYDFGTRAVGSTASRTFTVTNSGGFPATLGPVSGAGLGLAAPYTLGAGSTCTAGATVAAGASCTLLLSYAPTATGLSTDSIDLGYHDGATARTATRAVRGTALSPALLALSDGPAYSFGSLPVGTAATKSFTVTNSGGVPASLGTVTSAGLGLAAPFTLSGGTCTSSLSLAPAATCTLIVAYAPSIPGDFLASLDLGYDDGVTSRTVSRALGGAGLAPALLVLSFGPAYDFGTRVLGSSASETFVVTNLGGWPATLETVSSAGLGLAAPYALTGGTCTTGGTVAAAASCTLIVTYAPAATGSTSVSLALGYGDGAASRTASRPLTATAVGPALLAFAEGVAYEYGTILAGSSASKAFTVTNSGAFAATLGAVTGAGLGLAAPFALDASGTCATGQTVAVGASCTLVVTFAPTGPGSWSEALDLGYHDGAANQMVGQAMTAAAALPPENLDLPTIHGEPLVGQGLAATLGTWSNSPTYTSLQWLRCDSAGNACVDLPALGRTYAPLAASDAGITMRVRVTVANAVGNGQATSPPSPVIVQGGASRGFSGVVHSMALTPDDKRIVGGDFEQWGGVYVAHVARFDSNGSLDPSFVPVGEGVTGTINVGKVDGAGRVLVGRGYYPYENEWEDRGHLLRLQADGSFDPSFNTRLTVTNNAHALALDATDRILVGMSSADGKVVGRLLADGSLDPSFSVGTAAGSSTPEVRAIAVDGLGRIVIGGSFTSYDGVARTNIARLNADGTLDPTFAPTGTGLNGPVKALAIDASHRVLVAGDFTSFNGTSRNRILRLAVNGSLDAAFSPGAGFNGTTSAVRLDGAGRVLVGGAFTSFDGAARARIARLTTGGALDATFAPGTGFDGTVASLELDGSGRIMAGGDFTSYGGTARPRLARLQSSGALDSTFSLAGAGPSSSVASVGLDGAGRVVAIGSFESVNGQRRGRIARVNPDRTLDATFAPPGTGFDGTVRAVTLDGSGKVLAGGSFMQFNGTARKFLARLNSDGSLDSTFTQTGTGLDGGIYALALASAGRVVVGGWFSSYNGTARPRVARLNTDGSLDATFAPTGTGLNSYVYAVAVDPADRVLVGGYFTSYNGTARSRIARLNPDGSLDTSFYPTTTGFDSTVYALELDASGRILAGGSFNSYDGTQRRWLARLNPSGSLDQFFAPSQFGIVYDIFLEGSGKMLIAGGDFVRRLNPDGTADSTLLSTIPTYPGFRAVRAIAPDSAGRVPIAGDFVLRGGTLVRHFTDY